MINIEIIHKNDQIIKIKVYGHSYYDISGKDIVCAAISSVTQSVIIGLEKVLSDDFHYEIDEEKPLVYIDITNYDDVNKEKAQILLETFKYTVEEIAVDYKKYIKIRMKEETK